MLYNESVFRLPARRTGLSEGAPQSRAAPASEKRIGLNPPAPQPRRAPRDADAGAVESVHGAMIYAEDRKKARPAEHLACFDGVLQVDGYGGFKRLAGERADQSIRLAFCWAHMRRDFFQFHASTKSPLAAEVLTRVAALYAIEAEIRGQAAEHRRRIRQERSRPIVEALHDWLLDHVDRVSGASDLAKAIRYAIRHWPGWSRSLTTAASKWTRTRSNAPSGRIH